METVVKWYALKDAVITKKPGEVKVRFTHEGKRYKMLLDEETFNALETPLLTQDARQLTLKEGDE